MNDRKLNIFIIFIGIPVFHPSYFLGNCHYRKNVMIFDGINWHSCNSLYSDLSKA